MVWSISYKICKWRCCALFVCGYIDGLVQGCYISIANALEILQSCTKPYILPFLSRFVWFIHPCFQCYFTSTGATIWFWFPQWWLIKPGYEYVWTVTKYNQTQENASCVQNFQEIFYFYKLWNVIHSSFMWYVSDASWDYFCYVIINTFVIS